MLYVTVSMIVEEHVISLLIADWLHLSKLLMNNCLAAETPWRTCEFFQGIN
jgi:hypothetical protein